jgi:hypothetical protein
MAENEWRCSIKCHHGNKCNNEHAEGKRNTHEMDTFCCLVWARVQPSWGQSGDISKTENG